MNFYDFRTGDYVKFNPRIRQDYIHLDDPHLWQDEPFECVFEVSKVEKDDDLPTKNRIHLCCVNSCGNHLVEYVSESDCISIDRALEEQLLLRVNFSELSDAFFPEEDTDPSYNFQSDVKDIEDLIMSGALPERLQK